MAVDKSENQTSYVSKLYICAFQCQHLFVTLFASIYCRCTKFALNWCYLRKFALKLVLFEKICIKFGAYFASKFKEIMQKQHLLMVLFGTNLVSSIGTKASKKHHIQYPMKIILMQIRCRFNTHFSWDIDYTDKLSLQLYKF